MIVLARRPIYVEGNGHIFNNMEHERPAKNPSAEHPRGKKTKKNGAYFNEFRENARYVRVPRYERLSG
ncbi:hypothetical protein CDAR_429561 [Caerostris darwini]|uniref:Uncharacterized protein n=1 Tax=Caerostris darwini TaxID=1538125 RepID=A0AAV4VVU1_9ARAC|nr:hypothetical protein CDAR_429561 [Caerostris darwini]